MEKKSISICIEKEIDKLSYAEFEKIYEDSRVFFESKWENEVFYLEHAKISISCNGMYLLIPYYTVNNKVLFINDIFSHYQDYKSICILPLKEIIFNQVETGKTQETDFEIPFMDSFVNDIEFFEDVGLIIKFSSYNESREELYDYHYVLINYRFEVLSSSNHIFNKRIKNPVYKNFPYYDLNSRRDFENLIYEEYPEYNKPCTPELRFAGNRAHLVYKCKKNILYLSYTLGKKIDIRRLEKIQPYLV